VESLHFLWKPNKGLVFPTNTSLLALERFAPANFVHGIEFLNDDKTPMKFVVVALEQHLGLNRASATRVMLKIHEEGGILMSLSSFEEAARIANAITNSAKEKGHPLVCRAVSTEMRLSEPSN